MKTKIFMMTALLALLATGCGKDKFNGFRIVAENMQVANDGSKLVVNPNTMAAEWCAGEMIMVNGGNVYEIQGNTTDGYSITGAEPVADVGGYYYAIYPGGDFDGNDVTISGTNAEPVITLNSLTIEMLNDGSHHVAFPMGAKAAASATTMEFKHLTAAFRLTLHATAAVPSLTQLRVYVYGNSSATVPANVNDMNYIVQWANTGLLPNLPIGPVGDIEDRDLKYGSEMIFNLKANGEDYMSFGAGDYKTFCIPVTLTQAKRITVVGYNGEAMVFAKTSDLSAHLTNIDRNKVYPVKTININ